MLCTSSTWDIDMVAARLPWWTWAWPVLAWIILTLAAVLGGSGLIAVVLSVALLGTVFAAAYHAKVVTHRVGEPFGTAGPCLGRRNDRNGTDRFRHDRGSERKRGVARDTVFAAVMIVCNGIVGVCLLAVVHVITNRGFRVFTHPRAILDVGDGTIMFGALVGRDLGPSSRSITVTVGTDGVG
jgi:Ca2+:H+ antiporter